VLSEELKLCSVHSCHIYFSVLRKPLQIITTEMICCKGIYLFTYLLTYLLTYVLTLWRFFLRSEPVFTVSIRSKNYPHYMEDESSLPHSRQPATCPILNKISPCPHPTSRRSILIQFSHLRLSLPHGPFPSTVPTKPCIQLFSQMRVTFHANPIRFFIRIINCEWSSLLSSSLFSLIHSPLSTSLLNLNIQSTLHSNTLSQRSSLNVSNQV